MKSVRWIVSYILVAAVGLWLAFAVSMKFMPTAHSQEAPENGDLPPEFMKELEDTQGAPAPKGTPAPNPAPVQNEVPVEVPFPPPETFMGDGMTAPAPVSEIVSSDGYTYDPTGKRDPFKPFRTVRAALVEAKAAVEVAEPLQRWELDRLQVVGILWDVRTPRAMVRDPDGSVYTVTKNSKIGRHEGFVATIREGEVVIVETKYEDGKSFKETRVLELKK